MFDKVRNRIRDKVRVGNYRFTTHGEREMARDDLFHEDVEHIILTGEIVERQKDDVTDEYKYVIHGETQMYETGYVVVKVDTDDTIIIVTVFLA